MEVSSIIGHPAIQNLVILIAAIVGVGGSYLLYRQRLQDRRRAVRRAILSELESFDIVEVWGSGVREIPAQPILSMDAYKGNIENIGLLPPDETDQITQFYTRASIVHELIRTNREMWTKAGLNDVQDVGREAREDAIQNHLDNLRVKRWQAMQYLKKGLGESHTNLEQLELPDEVGETVSSEHPVMDEFNDVLVANGYFEKEGNKYKLTEKGEEKL